MVMANRFKFRWEVIDMPNTSHPSFALILSTMNREFGCRHWRWDFDVVERVRGFPTVRVGVMTQADWDAVKAYRYLGLLP